MLADNLDQRLAVVAEARSWLGTPYHHRAAIRGVGVDCALLLLEAFASAQIIDRFDVDPYTCDWHLHRGEERYLNHVEGFTRRLDLPGEEIRHFPKDFSLDPATILMWRVGRTYSHGGIVTTWPFIIHSYLPSMIVEEVDVRRTPMAFRPVKAYSAWEETS